MQAGAGTRRNRAVDACTAETAWVPRRVGKELRLTQLGGFDAD